LSDVIRLEYFLRRFFLMKKNYALFLTGIVALGLIFSLGFTGCENAVGETGPAGADYFNKIQIVRVDKPATTVVVARAATAAFGVQYYEDGWKDVPDPATVAWKVYGAGQEQGNEKSVAKSWIDSTKGAGYGFYNGYKTELNVAIDEPCASLFVEASYRGWTHTVEVQVGIPFVKINLEPGATTKIGHSHITQYDWVGRDGKGQTADATTYLVYETRAEPVADLTGWDTTPDGVVSYHLNDDILVNAGQYVTFYEVDANDPNKIISYGYEQGYIRARGTASDGKVVDLGSGSATSTVTIHTNIRLPTIEELPKLTGFYTGPDHTTHNGTPGDDTTAVTAGVAHKDGDPLVKVATAGTKVFDGKVSVVYEGDIFKEEEYNPVLFIKDAGGYVGGYDLVTPPSTGAEVKPDAATGVNFSPKKKIGSHRYVVVHSSGAWTVAENGVSSTSPTPNGDGVFVNQNNVEVVTTENTVDGKKNILDVDLGANRWFKKEFANVSEFTSTTGFSPIGWFVGADGYNAGLTFSELSQKVTLLNSTGAIGTSVQKITIANTAFAWGSETIPSGLNVPTANHNIQAKWKPVNYAKIDGVRSGGFWTEGGNIPNNSTTVTDNAITYMVIKETFGLELDGLTGPEPTGDDHTGNDRINIKWYFVNGPEWTNIKYSRIWSDSDTGIGYLLEPTTQWIGGGMYQSEFNPRLSTYPNVGPGSTGHGTNPQGKTIGLIVTPKSPYDVKFVDPSGNKRLNQFIVGVLNQ
jgi:hypothetical protein